MHTYNPDSQSEKNVDFTNEWRRAVLGDQAARKALIKNIVRH